MDETTCLVSPRRLLKSPPLLLRQIVSCPFKGSALRRHLYLSNLALHLCPLDLPGGLVAGVGLLQLAPARLLLPQLLPELLQQRPQGLQQATALTELHTTEGIISRGHQQRHTIRENAEAAHMYTLRVEQVRSLS